MDSLTATPVPQNEPVLTYAPGTPERVALQSELAVQASQQITLHAYINGKWRSGRGEPIKVVQPHRHDHVLGVLTNSTVADAQDAIRAATQAAPGWRDMPLDERCAILLKAAELLSGKWRQRLNAATMLGQSKTPVQAEIDAACELADFWRFNAHFAKQIYATQPITNSAGVWNRTDHRPLEGFVYAISPFNFTAIAGNLPTAPALMGNTVLWKPAPTQQLAASLTMELLVEAGMPDGVINMLPGDGLAVSQVALNHRDLAGIHFTGSTTTLHRLWRAVGENIEGYRAYPRISAETGGKDFLIAHASADPEALSTALIRGAFEYQGQKCSAASRAYVARSVWQRIRASFLAEVDSLVVGDVRDFDAFMGAVIDQRAFDKNAAAIERAHALPHLQVLAGGTVDDREGWFVRPTVIESSDPADEVFSTEYFGPILAIYVYEDDEFAEMLKLANSTSQYALTGAIMARDRAAILRASNELRFAAGNFYVNDKPTGAVVGQQPFGGSRKSGTNDKAGAASNLFRWTSPRSVKETFVPPSDFHYPYEGSVSPAL